MDSLVVQKSWQRQRTRLESIKEETFMNLKLQRRVGLCLIGLAIFPTILHSAVLTQCDEVALRAAIEQGGLIQFDCDGVVPFSSVIAISKPVTLDANGHSVTLSGQNKTQLFMVGPEGELTLRGLTVSDGHSATNGGAIGVSSGILDVYQCRFLTNRASAQVAVASNGLKSSGGAIYNLRGKVSASHSRFMYNTADGGTGGSSLPGGDGLGGAIYSEAGWLSLTNCDFSLNNARGGAGGDASGGFSPGSGGAGAGGSVYLNGAQLTVVDSDFLGCIAFGGNGGFAFLSSGSGGLGRGGAIAMSGDCSVLIQGANLNGNVANGGNSGRGAFGGVAQGGAVFCGGGQLVLQNSNLKDNEAFPGYGNPHGGTSSFAQGGALFNTSTSIVTRCLIQNNKVTGGVASTRPSGPGGGDAEGAGIYNDEQLLVEQSALIGNIAIGGSGSIREGFGFPPNTAPGGDGRGAGIFSTQGEAKLLNTTLANNTTVPGPAVDGGSSGIEIGGAFYTDGTASIRFCTIARNESTGGSVVSRGFVTLANSIVAYTSKGPNLVGKFVDLGHNISSDSSGGFQGPGSRRSTNPLLLPLGDNGGSTPTMALAAESPAVDAAVDDNPPATDQRGVARPALRGLDIGAYELLPAGFQITSLRFDGDREIVLSGAGPLLQSFAVEASSNLRDWQEIATGRADSLGDWSVQVPNTATTTFYRAK
ncbi:MAG: hypothetical protein JNN07_06035 [Verrucomicrobiales bacterium]|nr:hypothetical protein [Verrucomicrobiales bacterium]